MAAVVLALVVRGVILGWEHAPGLSVTYFPAFIVATLYAGQAWGWMTLAIAMVGGMLTPAPLRDDVSDYAIMAMFVLSAAITIVVAAALRSVILLLSEARAALSQSEGRLRLAQEAGEVGLWSWDVGGEGAGYWSPTLYRNIGLPPDTPPDPRTLMSVTHPDDREALRQLNIAAVKHGRMEPFEYRVIWPDGQVRWLLSRGEMLRDETGKVIRAVGVNIDITARREAFDRVQESEARFRALADSAPVLLWVSKPGGSREFANQAYVDFLGVTYEDAVSFDWRKRLHPDDLPRILEEQLAGEASRATFTLEARYHRADGAWRWIRSISQPRLDPSGQFLGFIGIAYDITEAKQAAVDLMRINDLLAERVEAALAERDAAEAQLRHAQRLEAVGRLTGGVAHDFNNLLTVIIGALDRIQGKPGDAERRDRMIEAALSAARRGERLTQQLLAFSRRQNLQPQAVSLDRLLIESEPLLQRAIGEIARLSVAPGAIDAVAMVDPSQFETALLNLVVNARDAVQQGGSVRIDTARRNLGEGEVAEVPAGAYVRVAVRDDGAGMAPDVAARVFEPFFTTKDVGKGTGLGLSQVYGFARQSGGGVAIDTAPGAGCEVSLYLPLVHGPAPREPELETPRAQLPGPANLKVLLVEDESDVRDMVAAMLEDLGHTVLRADGPEAALDQLSRQVSLDLMITDLVMPGHMNGVDLARQAVAQRPSLPVILSSAYTGDALKTADEAPWPLLRKPYRADALAAAIRDAVVKSSETAL